MCMPITRSPKRKDIKYHKKKTSKKPDYPQELIIIPNKDKSFHEKWDSDRDPLNFPHPYRMLLCSIQPNLGKTLWIKNILLRAYPKFKEIFLLHCGEEQTEEYDEIDYFCLKSVPPPTSDIFNPKVKSLLIIEDKNFKYMTKDDLHNLDRAYGFTSTHRNLSIITASQSFFDVPCSVRRMSNVYVIWKNKDLDSMKIIGKRVGLLKEEIWNLIKKYLKDAHDNLWIDATKNSPYPIRKNGYEIIDKGENNIE